MQNKNVLENLQLHYLQYLVIIDVSCKKSMNQCSARDCGFSLGFPVFPPPGKVDDVPQIVYTHNN